MRDNLAHTIVLECLNILLGQHLKQVLVPQTSCWITSAGFLLPQNSKAHPGCLQNFHEGLGYLNITIYQGTRASDPEEILSVRVISQQWYLQALGPACTCSLSAAPGMPTLLHTAQRCFGGFWHAALFEDQVAAHIDDGIDVLNRDRTMFLTGPTGRTRPQHIIRDHISEHTHVP